VSDAATYSTGQLTPNMLLSFALAGRGDRMGRPDFPELRRRYPMSGVGRWCW